MRCIFLILLIVMLPLRGMVGDAMAVQMMMPGSPATDIRENPPCKAIAIGDNKQSAMPCQDVVAAESDADCDACVSCDVCHLSAFVSTFATASLAMTVEVKPASPEVQMVSAELILVVKPPVS